MTGEAEGTGVCRRFPALDALPQGHATTYIRSLLTTGGLLPSRDENLALLINWTARTLAKLPGRQATLIRPFAERHVVRDARRRSARGRYIYTAHKGDCANIRAAPWALWPTAVMA